MIEKETAIQQVLACDGVKLNHYDKLFDDFDACEQERTARLFMFHLTSGNTNFETAKKLAVQCGVMKTKNLLELVTKAENVEVFIMLQKDLKFVLNDREM